MKILSFYRQQIILPVDGMQNSHHWYVMLARATTGLLINIEGSKSNNACTVYLRYHHTIGTEYFLKVAETGYYPFGLYQHEIIVR